MSDEIRGPASGQGPKAKEARLAKAVEAGRYTLGGRPLSREEVELLKTTIAPGVSDLELVLFLGVATRLGLDPFLRQIHGVMRWSKQAQRKVMVIQVAIDGLRAIADATGEYAGSPDVEYDVAEDGSLVSATATVRRAVSGRVVEWVRTAWWAESVQTDAAGAVTSFWAKMPRRMLGKCAEAAALRAAFPRALHGLYEPAEPMVDAEAAPVREEAPAPKEEPQRPAERGPTTEPLDPAEAARPVRPPLVPALPEETPSGAEGRVLSRALRTRIMRNLSEASKAGSEVRVAVEKAGLVGKRPSEWTDEEVLTVEKASGVIAWRPGSAAHQPAKPPPEDSGVKPGEGLDAGSPTS